MPIQVGTFNFIVFLKQHPAVGLTFAPMNNNTFEQIQSVIKNRRTTKPADMNGRQIPDEQIHQLLELAHWAPTHGRTEPWHFFVYAGDALKQFGRTHADIYWNSTTEDKRTQASADKLIENADKASHLLVAVMKRGSNPKIPQIEEIAAASAAVQNILLGATALGISAIWSTGGMALRPEMKAHLQLGEEDIVLGFVYMGYTDNEARQGTRNSHHSEKATWM